MNIGTAIKELRSKKGYKQGKLAKEIGVTQSYLCLVELNKKTPSLDIITKISEVTNTPIPIIFWLGINDNDVREEKKTAFKLLKPSIDCMIYEVFN